jgi:hypothetical protein
VGANLKKRIIVGEIIQKGSKICDGLEKEQTG